MVHVESKIKNMAKPIAMSILKQIIRHWCNGVPVKAIARHTSVSRNTVKHYLKTIGEQKLGCNELLSMQDHQLEQMLLESPLTNPVYIGEYVPPISEQSVPPISEQSVPLFLG